MRDFRTKDILIALPVMALAWAFVLVMSVYLLPVIPLVIISAKVQKHFHTRMNIVEKPIFE